MAYPKSQQVQTSILTSPQLLAEIDALARAEGVSRSDIIRRWLRIGRAVESDRVDRAASDKTGRPRKDAA